MNVLGVSPIVPVVVLVLLGLSVRVVKQYEGESPAAGAPGEAADITTTLRRRSSTHGRSRQIPEHTLRNAH